MSELEPRKRRGLRSSRKKALVPRHIPSEVVPVPVEDVEDFVRDALRGTSLRDPFAQILGGYALFAPQLRFVPVDETHTRVEFDAVGRVAGAEALKYTRRLGEIDRFFVALRDELDRREQRRRPPAGERAIEDGG
ncbi:hypothetical protein [Leifsonia shinshuensis]|uniref:hypothetical protein n=1 Tax=Leifsonia shinshuensis TaxID=150026 RepID=UPI0028603875|nr:hypothetical protein [Leifsonia shinshuensis]MDR6972754.1 hypothetical protein [Leifsonia shinshuensis]